MRYSVFGMILCSSGSELWAGPLTPFEDAIRGIESEFVGCDRGTVSGWARDGVNVRSNKMLLRAGVEN